MKNYQTRKAAARDAAIMAQQEAAEHSPSYGEIAETADRLERLARPVSVSCGSSGKTALSEQRRRNPHENRNLQPFFRLAAGRP